MNNLEDILKSTEDLIHRKTSQHLSDLQRTLLFTALKGSRKTYTEIAEEYGYSCNYVKQQIAPQLWQLLSQVLDQKITKFNAKAILEHQIPHQETVVQSSLSIDSAIFSSHPALASERVNILLVDDEPDNLTLLSDLLEDQGYKVQQAINGKVALQAISLTPPDLILLDICLPDLEGYTLCQMWKANPKTQNIPVIFLSALDAVWDIVKAFSMGGADYITKPFKVVEVLARVENQLKVQRLQQALRENNRQLQETLRKLEVSVQLC